MAAAGLTWALAGGAWAAGVAGKTTYVKGQVQKGPTVAGPFATLKRGQRVGEHEVIKTGPESRVELTFSDGSRLRLPSNSTMQLGPARGAQAGIPSEVRLSAGSLWAQITKALGGDAKFAVKTNNAVAGVRGTVLQVFTAPDGSTITVVYEGQVAVTNAVGALEKVVDSGKGNVVLPDGTVLDPEDMQALLDKAAAMLEPDWMNWNQQRDGEPPELVEDDKAPGAEAGQDEGLKVKDDISKLSGKEMQQKADGMLTEMRASLRSSLDLIAQARRQKDVVRLNCLNDRVTPMKGVLKVAEDAAQGLQEQAASGDLEAARGSYTKIALARERIATLRVQAQNCVGAESYYGGDTEVTTDVNPQLAGGDPFFGDRAPGSDATGDFADGPKDVGDNTSTETPPPPPPTSSFH